MEHKSSREKAWVASKGKKTNVIVNDGSNSEINNLQDESFVELEEFEEEPVPLTEEEKLEIRKKIGILLIFVVIAFFIMLIILIFDPFAPRKSTEKEEKEEEKEEEVKVTLYEYEDGDINTGDKYITSIYNEIKFRVIDNYEYDTFFLYRNNETKINTLSDIQKIVLLSKTNDFNTLLEKISTSGNVCEEKIDIDVSKMDEILLRKYGTIFTPTNQFKYNYYYSDSYIASILFTLDGNVYHGKCYDRQTKLTKMIEQELVSATKKDNYLYLDVKAAFITEKGVFKDPNFKTLITNDRNASFDTYMQKANTYRYTYVISKDGYYLDNIALKK